MCISQSNIIYFMVFNGLLNDRMSTCTFPASQHILHKNPWDTQHNGALMQMWATFASCEAKKTYPHYPWYRLIATK